MIVENKIKVWDTFIRTFHWSLVMLFFTAYLTGDEESMLHIYAGYGVLGLLIFRIIWGFIGTKHARFSNFVFGPQTTRQYISSILSRKPVRYIGHNPLGGWMVILLLVTLGAVTWSGLELYASEGHGPLASKDIIMIQTAQADEDNNEHKGKRADKPESREHKLWEEVHEIISNFGLMLVFLHIAGVIFGSILHHENLIRAMITGYKDKPSD